MRPLVTDNQMMALQRTAESSYRVPVTIKRPVFSSDDLGDDAFDAEPETIDQPQAVLRDGVLYGYLRQTTGATVGSVDLGQIVTMSTYELALPVGTDVLPRDVAEVTTRGRIVHDFFIQDVQDDETWPALLNCILRQLS